MKEFDKLDLINYGLSLTIGTMGMFILTIVIFQIFTVPLAGEKLNLIISAAAIGMIGVAHYYHRHDNFELRKRIAKVM